MSKYQLVATKYDLYNNKYDGEVKININGIDMTDLIEIDKFTSTKNLTELWDIIKSQNDIPNNFNTLSIKYIKSNNDSPIYMRTFINNDIIAEASKNIVRKTIHSENYHRTNASFVDTNTECFKNELSIIKDILKLGYRDAMAKLKEICPYNNNLSLLITRYLSSSYDNQFIKDKELEAIYTELSNYKTFRGLIVASYNKKYSYSFPKTSRKDNTKSTKPVQSHKEEKVSTIGLEEELAYKYNLSHLDEDKEEFIEPDEIEQMYNLSNEHIKK